jgi:hypothetical protein
VTVRKFKAGGRVFAASPKGATEPDAVLAWLGARAFCLRMLKCDSAASGPGFQSDKQSMYPVSSQRLFAHKIGSRTTKVVSFELPAEVPYALNDGERESFVFTLL